MWADDPDTVPVVKPTGSALALDLEDRLYTELLRDKSRAERIAKDIDKALAADNKEDMNNLLYKAATSSEYLTRNLRVHAGSRKFRGLREYLLEAAALLEISITESDNGIIEITIPSLLPKRHNKGANFIYDPLYEALRKYSVDHGTTQRRGKSVMCFIHHYDKELGIKGRVRDHDNHELKDIKDIISLYFLVDDSGYWCSDFHDSTLFDKDKTSILIMSPEQFKEWILSHLKGIKNIRQNRV